MLGKKKFWIRNKIRNPDFTKLAGPAFAPSAPALSEPACAGRWRSWALVRAAERATQITSRLQKQHLILTDSKVMLGVAQKGRSSVPQLNRFARRLAALTLGYRQCFFFRWVPTKLNPADEPSREFGDLLQGKPIGGRTGNKGTGLDASGVTPGSTRGPLRGLSP